MADVVTVQANQILTTEPETRGWYAWNDLMPPRPHVVRVIGEVLVDNPGVQPVLSRHEPQGINPAILCLDLRLRQDSGMWPQVQVWKAVQFEGLTQTPYSRALIFFEDQPIVSVDVETIHVDPKGTVAETALANVTRSAGEIPFPRVGGWSGENPFPWMKVNIPFCFTGGLSTIQFDTCMDGVKYSLSVYGSQMRIRVRGANAAIEAELATVADKRVLVSVCGSFKLSIENGCQYLSVTRVQAPDVLLKALA